MQDSRVNLWRLSVSHENRMTKEDKQTHPTTNPKNLSHTHCKHANTVFKISCSTAVTVQGDKQQYLARHRCSWWAIVHFTLLKTYSGLTTALRFSSNSFLKHCRFFCLVWVCMCACVHVCAKHTHNHVQTTMQALYGGQRTTYGNWFSSSICGFWALNSGQ